MRTADARIDEVIEFWFSQPFMRWFEKDPAFDEEIRTKFGALQEQAARGELDAWSGTAHGGLALLVLLDQFPRNLFRDDPRAFATDAKALAIARTIDRSSLRTIQQLVSLIPYQHAEDLSVQDEGLIEYVALAASHPDDKMLASSLEFAKRHREIIARFGRFPHRNATLGRTSTPEELAFLQTPGSSF